MAITHAGYIAYLEAAQAALAAGDYASAKLSAVQAQTLLAGLLDARHGDAEIRYARESITALISQIDSLAGPSAASGPSVKIRFGKVRYAHG